MSFLAHSRTGPVRARPLQTQQTYAYENGEQQSSRYGSDEIIDVDELTTTNRYSSRPLSASSTRMNPIPAPVGPTLVPSTIYRSPSGTALNRVPHSARERLKIAEAQRETQERLRAKALDRKLRDAVILTQRSGASRPQSAQARPRSASAKKAAADSRRHLAQRQRQEQAVLSQDEISLLSQPYEPISSRSQHYHPSLQSSVSQPQFLTTNGRPISQPGSARKPQYGRLNEPADKTGRLISSSTQSRLTPAEIAEQPVAGMPSNSGIGNNLAEILGGGHENVIFGQRNAPSAQTRQQVGIQYTPTSPLLDPETKKVQAAYAPYALHIGPTDVPEKFNDPTGAVMVRDDLSLDVRHAPASLGFGKAHSGFKAYVSKPAAATGLAYAAAHPEGPVIRDPFSASANILSWNTDGIERKTRSSDLKALQQKLWSKTSGDYGTQGSVDETNLSRPVAGSVQGQHEPLKLYYPEDDRDYQPQPLQSESHSKFTPVSPGAKHSSGCGPKCSHKSVPIRATSSSGNPLNPYTPQELANLTARPSNLAASAIGFGKKHAQYKTFVLGASSMGQQAQI